MLWEAETTVQGRDTARATQSGRPWLLIAASLLLALLATVLWAKWRDSRVRADRLQAELRQVYAEAEALRTEAARTQQRAAQLERELRAVAPRGGKEQSTAKNGAGR
jgi:hypothetical protein